MEFSIDNSLVEFPAEMFLPQDNLRGNKTIDDNKMCGKFLHHVVMTLHLAKLDINVCYSLYQMCLPQFVI